MRRRPVGASSAQINIYLGNDLAGRMGQLDPQPDWSKIARAAFEVELAKPRRDWLMVGEDR